MTLPAHIVATRLERVRALMRAADLDAFVVTHLPNLQYLTGFSGSAGAAVLTLRSARLIVDFRYVTAAGALVSDLDGLFTAGTIERSYDQAIVAHLRLEGSRRTGIEAAYLPVARYHAIAAGLAARAASGHDPAGAPAVVPTERVIERVRILKDATEIAALREGGRRIADVGRRVGSLVHEGRTERAIARDIEVALQEAGFVRLAFETIVASGPNSVLPHARPTDRAVRAGDSAVLDFGGVYDGYCVDLTGTVQLGPVSEALSHVYDAVAEAQSAAIRAVRPGIASSAVDAAARTVLERHGLGEVFGHGTGHGLGLEVHEEPRIGRHVPSLPDLLLEPGMVFTVEPGAYVPGLGGVRIEDDVLVTDTGCEVITR